MKQLIILFLCISLFSSIALGEDRKNIKELFENNEAIIYAINIRNFGATDTNGNGLIDNDEQAGTFLNAIDKLKELKQDGINTIYLLPVTPVGKLKALGTAGSLYAMDEFNKINEQLIDKNSNLNEFEQVKKFTDEAHKLGLNVILDLPSCGSYDMALRKPDWFIRKDLIPADWTDVRLFKVFKDDEQTQLNPIIVQNFKQFCLMAVSLGFDGIRADVAAIKPYQFWKEIIDYTKELNKNFIFLAEASPMWDNPCKNAIKHYSSIDELLYSGFDSYYGSWSNFKDIQTRQEFENNLKTNFKILKKHKNSSIISSLATHDQKAPILTNENFQKSVLWLSVTLPQNTYFLDGFNVADDFIYDYENKNANFTLTDDNQYFVHTGQADIFNLTAPVRAKNPNFKQEYLKAIDFKIRNMDLINNGKFKFLNTNNDKIYAYSITNFEQELIVVGSIDNKNDQKTSVQSKYLKQDNVFLNVTNTDFNISNNIINVDLKPNEIKVFLIGLSKYRAM